MTEINHQLLNSTIEDLLYEYDPNGNRKSYTRNALQPLRTGVTGTSYDDANEMLSFTPAMGSSKNMTYDNNGNLLTVTNNCGTTTYTWDVRNRLVGISGYKPDCSALIASFSYDAIGRRISKTINGTTTQYLYDGLDIIQELQGGTPTVNYVRSPNIDEPLTRIEADGTIRHYVADALGSIIALTDDSGVVKTTYTYDPFGNVTVSGEASDNPFQYTGRENDGTGLYYYRARYYSPELQRMISEDPIGLAGGINKYVYVDNRPTVFIDPTGLLCVYSQSTGSMTCTNDATGLQYLSCSGLYAGNGSGLNNPNAQNQHNVGPLPQGNYVVGAPNNRRGPYTRPLTPDPSNNMFGRSGFLIHGDNAAQNNSASEGCIVAPRDCRSGIPTGETLRVTP